MRIVTIIAALTLAALRVPSAEAQVSLGVQSGVHYGNADADRMDPTGNRMGIYAGILADFPIFSVFSIQTELLYIQKGGERIFEVAAGTVQVTGNIAYRLDYLQLPLLLRASIGSGSVRPVLMAGGYGALRLDAHADTQTGNFGRTLSIADQVEEWDFGALFGGGFDYDVSEVATAFLFGRYELGTADALSSGSLTWKNRGFHIAGGVRVRI